MRFLRDKLTGRSAIRVVLVLAIIVFVAAAAGFELPKPTPPEAPRAGARARSANVVIKPSGEAQIGELAFMAVEADGTVIATDRGTRSIRRFDRSGRQISNWGPLFAQAGEIGEPAGIAVEGDHYFVVDRGTECVLRLDRDGRVMASFALQQIGPYGMNGIAVDSAGRIYVCDTGRNRILVLDNGGRFIREIGLGGAGSGQLKQPMSVSFGPDGSMFVADWENGRIAQWDKEFQPVREWTVGFKPYGVAVDRQGRVYVPDADQRKVKVFAPASGTLLGELSGSGGAPIEVSMPRQVALGADGVLYLLGGAGIARVEIENTAPPPQASAGDLLDPSTLAALGLVVLVALLALDRRRRRASGVAELSPS